MPPQPPQYDFPPRQSYARSLPQQPCSDSGVAIDMGTEELERNAKDTRREILIVDVFGNDKIKSKMEPEWIAFEPSLLDTGLEAPGQPRLSCREIQ